MDSSVDLRPIKVIRPVSLSLLWSLRQLGGLGHYVDLIYTLSEHRIKVRYKQSMPCYICGNQKHNRSFVVREMQMGLREEFPYFECSACGCLQLARVPEDLSPYYPSNYFSHRIVSNDDTSAREPLKARVIRSLLTRHFFFRRSLVTGWVARRSCIVEEYPQWVQRQHLDLKLRTTARVLDVGSGRGKLLMELRHNGFTALCGIDPFIEGDLTFSDGVRVFKRHLHAVPAGGPAGHPADFCRVLRPGGSQRLHRDPAMAVHLRIFQRRIGDSLRVS